VLLASDSSALPAAIATIGMMSDFRKMARDPEHRRNFEKLLYLGAKRGDGDLVEERLSWGIDPNCVFAKGRTPLIANVRGFCPSAETVRALLKYGADPSLTDESGLTALDHARRKLARIQARLRRRPCKSSSLDENDQLKLSPEEQAELDEIRREVGGEHEYLRMWWKERLRAARRVFNDPDQIEQIMAILEEASA
jgi:hypothetical protein